jgi:hypothetical protein
MDIFIVNAMPRPETLDDLRQYLVDKIPALFRTLKAWEDELTVQEGQTMGGTFMEDVRGFMVLEQEWACTDALLVLQKEQVPVAWSILNLKESICYDKQVNAAIMKELGWKKYGDDANMPDMPYLGEEGLKRTKWVCYNMSSPNPLIEGTNRPGEPIYAWDLHAVSQPHPNFDEAKGFQDDRLQIFHPTFKSRMLIDHALGEWDNVGLRGEVNRFRHWANEQDKKYQRHTELEAEILHTEQEYHTSTHYLVQARSTSRVSNQTFTHAIQMQAPISQPHLPSPIPNHTLLFTASPGPIEGPNTPPKEGQAQEVALLPHLWSQRRPHQPQVQKPLLMVQQWRTH